MKAIKQFVGGIFLCLIEILIGILLLIDPVGFTAGIIAACGAALLVWGILCVVRYFRMDAGEAAQTHLLVQGMAFALAGLFCAVNSNWLIATIPVMTIVYGLMILASGLGKIQWAVDLIRQKKGKWFLALISAVISIICGGVILSNPFTTTAVLWTFTGISMICEAVIDVVTYIFSGFAKKTKEEAAIPEVEAEEAE